MIFRAKVTVADALLPDMVTRGVNTPPEIMFKKNTNYSRRHPKYSRTYVKCTVEKPPRKCRPSQETVDISANHFFQHLFSQAKIVFKNSSNYIHKFLTVSWTYDKLSKRLTNVDCFLAGPTYSWWFFDCTFDISSTIFRVLTNVICIFLEHDFWWGNW